MYVTISMCKIILNFFYKTLFRCKALKSALTKYIIMEHMQ